MIIDCGSCAVAGLACDDCVVSVLLGTPESMTSRPGALPDSSFSSVSTPFAGPDAVDVTDVADEHAAAIAVLAESGLVPPLRLVPRSQAS